MRLNPLPILLLLPALAMAGPAQPDRLADALALEKAGKPAEALAAYQDLLSGPLSWTEEVDAREGAARTLMQQGLFREAEEVYRGALARLEKTLAEAPSPAAARMACVVANRLSDYAASARHAESLLPDTCSPEDRAWAVEQRIVCYMRQNDWEGLKRFTEANLTLVPEGERRAALQFVIAKASANRGDIEHAESLLRQVVDKHPATPVGKMAALHLQMLKSRRQMQTPAVVATANSAPLDPRRLATALSSMVHPEEPHGIRGYRIERKPDGAGFQITVSRADGKPVHHAVATVAELEEALPQAGAIYRESTGAGLPAEAERPGYLGIATRPLGADLSAFLKLAPGTPGLLVTEVLKDSPAEKAGLRTGDVLLSVNDVPVDAFSVRSVVRAIPAGKVARLAVLRASAEAQTLEVETREAP